MLSPTLDLSKCTEWRQVILLCWEGQRSSQNPRGLGDNIVYQYFLEMELPLEVMGNKHIKEIDMNDVDRRLVQG